MKKVTKIISIILIFITTFTLVTGCSNKIKMDINNKKLEKVDRPTTGIVSDENGWELWDSEGNLTKTGRDTVGKNSVVSSGKYEASQAGLAIIEAGGNAIDAAVAVGFALCVVEPNATGISGGGSMLIRTEDGKEAYIDFRETAPQAANPYMWNLDSEGKVVDGANTSGGKSVAVPGQVAGLIYAFEKYGSGKVTLEQVMEPAIDLAENGFYVTPTLLKEMKSVEEMMEKYPDLKSIILNNEEEYYKVGDLYKNKDLGKILKIIAKEGKKGFYSGQVAESIVNTVKENGGILTLEDLKNYEVQELQPIKGTYRGKTIISAPLPSAGGTHILESLNILENFNMSKYKIDSAERAHILSETFKMVYADRAKYMGDADYVDVPIKGLTSKNYGKTLANKINMNISTDAQYNDPWIYEHEDTTHYSVADNKGNMVSTTQTINWTFGSGLVVENYGFVLNNEISDFATDPNSPNSVDGGKKPLSSMSPTIILNNDRTPFLVLGSPGGARIIPTVVQVISNVIDYNMNIQEAINQYRMYDNTKNKIVFEPGLNQIEINKLKNMGHKVEQYEEGYDKHFGGVQGIEYINGEMMGGADFRRDGKSVSN